MVLHSLFCTVLFGVLVATRSNLHEEESNDDVDIVRFWNTSDVIWTTNTTARARQVCKVDIKENISQTNVTFTRSYLVKTYRTSTRWAIKRYDGFFTTTQVITNRKSHLMQWT
uniref:Putative lipocalin n=1 Tax=Rhipicephalus microplus TaxID=6941 RepID=A0A6G5A0C4_RHIMP